MLRAPRSCSYSYATKCEADDVIERLTMKCRVDGFDTLKNEVDVLVINTEHTVKKTNLVGVNAIHSDRMCWRQTKTQCFWVENSSPTANMKYDIFFRTSMDRGK